MKYYFIVFIGGTLPGYGSQEADVCGADNYYFPTFEAAELAIVRQWTATPWAGHYRIVDVDTAEVEE